MRKITTSLLAALLISLAALMMIPDPPRVRASGYNGVVQGSPTYETSGNCKFGTCMSGFSSTNGVQLPAGVMNWSGPWTVEAWGHVPSREWKYILATSTSFNLGMASTTGAFFANVGVSPNNNSIISTVNTLNTWQHYALSWDGTAIRGFLDGVVVGTISTPAGTPPWAIAGTVQLGNIDVNGFWPGRIDEVAIWDTAKYTGAFTPPASAYTGAESGLRALYHLDGDVTDSSSAGPPLVAGTLSACVGLCTTAPTGGTSPYTYQLQSGSIVSGACSGTTWGNDGSALTGQTGSAQFSRTDTSPKCWRVQYTDAVSSVVNSSGIIAPSTGGGMRAY